MVCGLSEYAGSWCFWFRRSVVLKGLIEEGVTSWTEPALFTC